MSIYNHLEWDSVVDEAAITRAEIVKWVAQSLRPFSIVRDPGFLSLMKTGRPGMYIPSPSTVSRDAKMVFARTRARIAQLLRVSQRSMHERVWN